MSGLRAAFYEWFCSAEPGERVAFNMSMRDQLLRILRASVCAEDPGMNELEVRQQLFLRLYGHEFSEEQRERILAGFEAHWLRSRDRTPPGEPLDPPGPR